MRKWLYWGVPAVVLIGLVIFRFVARGASEAQTGSQLRTSRGSATSVEVVPTVSRTIVQTIRTVGNVESPFKVEISPKTSGRINYLQVREGDPVKAGQLVLTIDPSDLEGAVVQASANVADARSKLAQAKISQNATNVGVTSQVKQQSAGLASAKADYDQVQKNYEASVQQAQALVDAAEAGVRNASAALEREKANLKNAQTKYDRTFSLYQQGFVAAQDVDDAKTTVDVEKGAVGVQEAQLSSAQSQLNSQRQNLSIVKRKGTSDIADSKAKVDQAKAILDTALANRSQTPAYREQLVALQFQVDAAMAALSQAKARLADTQIRSSITGTVTARKADPGALAGPGSPVLEVQYLDWLFVTTTIPVEASSEVHEGQTAEITFDGLPGRTFTGPIINLNPAADPQSRQFGVSIRLANPDHALRPGMYGRVSIETKRVKAAVVVPREALKVNPDGTTTVTVVGDDDVAHVRSVKLGASDDKGNEILEGVAPSDRVVVLTYSTLRDGQKVSVGKPGGAENAAGKQRAGRRPQRQ